MTPSIDDSVDMNERRHIVGTGTDGIDLTDRAPHAERWLKKRRPTITVRVLEDLPLEKRTSIEQAGRRMMDLLLTPGIMRPILHLARQALNRKPTLALQMEKRRKADGLTIEQAATAIGISVEDYARYARSGIGLTPTQHERVAAWVKNHPTDTDRHEQQRLGETLHAAMPLVEFAARAGLHPNVIPSAIRAFLQTEEPTFFATGLLDGIRITSRQSDKTEQIVNVWVVPEQEAARFFAGGWIRSALAAHLRERDPSIDILIDPVLHVRRPSQSPSPEEPAFDVFSPAMIVARNGHIVLINPLTGRNPEQHARSLRRIKTLAPLLDDGDPRRILVVLAAPDQPFDRASMSRLSSHFGVTVTDLHGVVPTLDAVLPLLLERADDFGQT